MTTKIVATGTLLCVDRLKNIILSDVVEKRAIVDTDNSEGEGEGEVEFVERSLNQVLVPGVYLTKVEISHADLKVVLVKS
eukprot:CAMPEP_0194398422 /NCGR_PEP_ID=MMETSP0174-20130528/126091_1 /TAXON_ID=216777 /ORGANISM="Proboscia alata, Strain PI-D3" /LENGTH=79 /DNA_ID=CAMNT_0039194709 /DNA_START=916 /DNA_END=1155 /DNA_ORIENTATION=-